MTDAAGKSFIDLTASIVSAYLRNNPTPASEIPSLISQIILPVLTAAVTEVLNTARESLWRRLTRRLRRHRPDPVVPPFTAEQAALIHTACVRNAVAAGVSSKKAELIADAVYGSLTRALLELQESHRAGPCSRRLRAAIAARGSTRISRGKFSSCTRSASAPGTPRTTSPASPR